MCTMTENEYNLLVETQFPIGLSFKYEGDTLTVKNYYIAPGTATIGGVILEGHEIANIEFSTRHMRDLFPEKDAKFQLGPRFPRALTSTERADKCFHQIQSE